MASWDDIRAHIREKYRVTRDEPTGIALSWDIKLGSHQLVQGLGIAPLSMVDRSWLTMVSELLAEADFPLRTALLYQDRLPIGAIVLRDGTFLLRHNVAADIALPELDWTIGMLAYEAVRLRLNITTKTPLPSPFGNWAE